MLGIAFDLGTTTLVGYLCDIDKGIIINSVSLSNPQIEYGMDVLSRVSFGSESEENKKELTKILGNAAEELADSLVLEAYEDIKTDSIGRIVLVGNPVIMGTIASYSFSSELLRSAEVIRIPSIGGYVGADALAATYMVYLGMKQKQRSEESKACFMVDIGTNTEIALLSSNGIFVTSAAAGPAFEGGNISCGMRGEPGAIDRFNISSPGNSNADILFHVIEGAYSPKGICGSGIFSLIRVLLSAGVINRDGYLYTREEAIANHVPLRIASRIKDRGFWITEDIYFNQEDVRSVQLAVSAIRTGMDILVKKAGLTNEVIGQIYFAGAFGNKIDSKDIVASGMIDYIFKDKISQVGNIAGLGAVQVLLDSSRMTEVNMIKDTAVSIALANESEFQELFVRNMSFPKSE